MTISTFDLTENTQLAIRFDTDLIPGELALTIYTRAIETTPLEIESFDITGWDNAVKMAKWILKIDGEFNGGN